jgi:hypothetical protein
MCCDYVGREKEKKKQQATSLRCSAAMIDRAGLHLYIEVELVNLLEVVMLNNYASLDDASSSWSYFARDAT